LLLLQRFARMSGGGEKREREDAGGAEAGAGGAGEDDAHVDVGPPRPPPGGAPDSDDDAGPAPGPPKPKKKRVRTLARCASAKRRLRCCHALRVLWPPTLALTRRRCSRCQVLEHEHVYLDALPCAEMYEKSFMHRDVITHVVRTREAHNARMQLV
jgi:hypothetical protein